jgi:SAM-dependent methyltransferase
MTGWGGGYVTDITYMAGWYRQQSPAVLALACMLGGVMSPLPRNDEPVSYLELGCGQGYGALLLAASNPRWRVTAVDFNPAHIAAAREWAALARVENVTFLEADLSTLAESDAARAVPEADFVSLHGVWSWVPRAVQQGIVRLLAQKVRSGGVVHVSYNALPGWGSVLGAQRMLREVGRRAASRSDRQAEAGVRFLQELYNTEALHLVRSSMMKSLLDRFGAFPVSYLAHEYMNEDWAPCFMPDVANALSDAKLEFVGSARLLENFPDLTLNEQQRALVQQQDDPLLRELIKDHCIERQLRHDVYVRGARRIGTAARDAMLLDVHLSLCIPPQELPREVEMPAGHAELNQGFYRPIVEALSSGPRRIGDLLALPEVEGKRDNPAELVGILVGLDIAEPMLRPGTGPGETALRFNRLAANRLLQTEPLGKVVGVACEALGTGMHTLLCDLVVIDRMQLGDADLDALVRTLGPRSADPEKLREVLQESLERRIPLLKTAGVF